MPTLTPAIPANHDGSSGLTRQVITPARAAGALFIAASVLKAFHLAHAVGLSTRWAHASNLLLLIAVSALIILLPRRVRVASFACAAALASLVMFGDDLHYRFFREILSAHQLEFIGQLPTVWSSAAMLWKWSDLLYFADAPLWLMLLAWRQKPARGASLRLRAACAAASGAVYIGSIALFIFSPAGKLAFGETHRNHSYIPSVSRGILNYHLLDGWFYLTEPRGQRAPSPDEVRMVERFFAKPREEGAELRPFGAARGSNVILILVESLQAFAIGLEIEGQPVAPELTKLAREHYHFSRFFAQTGPGSTSDAEFVIMNSLLPAGQGAAVFRYQHNTYHALPRILAEHGYHTFAGHVLKGAYWNMWWMHRRYGFEAGYYEDSLVKPGENPWLVPDDVFFARMLPILKAAPKPFLAHLLTLTNHGPFRQVPPDRKSLKLGAMEATLIGDYLHSVHFSDAAIGGFLADLRQAGLYDNSLIVIYGDHEGIPAGFGGGPHRELDQRMRGRVPLIIKMPGAGGGKEIKDPAAQVDMAPSLLHLLGIDDPKARFLGRNLFKESKEPVAYLPSGAYLARGHLFTGQAGSYHPHKCHPLREETCNPAVCRQIFEDVRERISLSDKILSTDMLPKLTERPLISAGNN